MATSRTFPPETEDELSAWLRRFFETGEIHPEGMDRDDRTTTDRVRTLLRDPEFKTRVALLMPGFLKEWNEATTSETTERLCYTAGYSHHPDNIALLLSMYQRSRHDTEIIMRCLGGYHKAPQLHEIYLQELRAKRSIPISMICMRALCICWPQMAANEFKEFLDFVNIETVAQAKMISSMVRGIPLIELDKFLAVTTSADARVRNALDRYPLSLGVTRART